MKEGLSRTCLVLIHDNSSRRDRSSDFLREISLGVIQLEVEAARVRVAVVAKC
jgi:hypothetical protein